MGSELKLEIPEGQIQNAIAVALAESLTLERKDQMIRDIVRAHLTAKVSEYGRETVLGKTLGDAIRKWTGEELAKIVSAWQSDVEAEVRAVVGIDMKVMVLDQLRAALNDITLKNIRLRIEAIELA